MAAPPPPRAQGCRTLSRCRDATVFTWRVAGLAERVDNNGAGSARLLPFQPGVALRSAPFRLDGSDAWFLRLYPGGDGAAAAAADAAAAAAAAAGAPAAAPAPPARAMSLHVCCASRARRDGAPPPPLLLDGQVALLGANGAPVKEYLPHEGEYEAYMFREAQRDDERKELTHSALPLQRAAGGVAGGGGGGVEKEAAEAEEEVVLRVAHAIPHAAFARVVDNEWLDADDCLTLRLTLRAGVQWYTDGEAAVASAVHDGAPLPPPPAPRSDADVQLGRQLAALFDSGADADCALALPHGAGVVRAHRWLLSARSPVLAKALTDPVWAAQRAHADSAGAAPPPPLTLACEGVDAATLRLFVRCLYDGDVDSACCAASVPRETLLGLLRCADACDVPHLRAACERALAAALRVGNAADTLREAVRLEARALRGAIVSYVRSRFDDVAASEGWARLLVEAPLLQAELLRALVGAPPQTAQRKRSREAAEDDAAAGGGEDAGGAGPAAAG
jgi:hypothetical protein